jgi:hypothetical protein
MRDASRSAEQVGDGEVLRLRAGGDVQAAVRASRKARAWLIASGVLDVLGIILLIVIAQTPCYNTH